MQKSIVSQFFKHQIDINVYVILDKHYCNTFSKKSSVYTNCASNCSYCLLYYNIVLTIILYTSGNTPESPTLQCMNVCYKAFIIYFMTVKPVDYSL